MKRKDGSKEARTFIVALVVAGASEGTGPSAGAQASTGARASTVRSSSDGSGVEHLSFDGLNGRKCSSFSKGSSKNANSSESGVDIYN